MNYRILLQVPQELTSDALTVEQQEAVAGVLGQYVMPMPGTIANEGKVICDGIAADKFDASTLEPLGLPFKLIGQWRDDGTVIVPLYEETFLKHLPPSIDDEGNSTPPFVHEPHRWAGWPELF